MVGLEVARDARAVERRIAELFEASGAEGFLYARELDDRGGREVAVGAETPVVMASTFKIAVAVAFEREVSTGRLDPRERTTVTSRYRIGGVGVAGCSDDVEMSWRDLSLLMLTLSDNAATDLIYRRIGRDAVDAVLSDLGLTRTTIVGCCEDLFLTMAEDLGFDLHGSDLHEEVANVTPEQIWSLAVLDPARTSASTPREVASLLEEIWADRAAPDGACERIRSAMRQQVWPHRLSQGFPSDVQVAGKTGTLPAIRNEAGVVSYPDGRSFVVSVFTRAWSLEDRLPEVDTAIGRAARVAVDFLRETRSEGA
jgi:beta-lactamase class A